MKIEALNCPNCGACVSSDKTECAYCRSRLKTAACASCLGLMLVGSIHCSHCGAKTVEPQAFSEDKTGDCPRCRIKLNFLRINEIILRECRKCGGVWADAETFENVCAEKESQAAVLDSAARQHLDLTNKNSVRYVPCPDCEELMNRNNFARSSGVIIDVCKQHGVWFDAEELPKIIEFIHRGGLDRARRKEKLQIEEQKRNLLRQQRQIALQDSRYNQSLSECDTPSTIAVREFVRFLFD